MKTIIAVLKSSRAGLIAVITAVIFGVCSCFFRVEYLAWRNLPLVGGLAALCGLSFAVVPAALRARKHDSGIPGAFFGALAAYEVVLWTLLTVLNRDGNRNRLAIGVAFGILLPAFGALCFLLFGKLYREEKKRARRIAGIVLLVLYVVGAAALPAEQAIRDLPAIPRGEAPDLTGYETVFFDDFDGDELDLSVWEHRATGARRNGFNAASQAEVRDGNLILTAQYREDGEYGAGWYSGMVSLKQWYCRGYFEIRCKCNDGGDFWSAFWLQAEHPYDHELSAGGPGGCEIDIFEAMSAKSKIKAKRDAVSVNLHCNGGDDAPENLDSLGVGKFRGSNIYTEYNTYACLWNEDEYIFYVNGREAARSSHAKGVSQVPEQVIVSLEIPDGTDHAKDFTTQFVVDYVKICQLP